MTLLGGDYLGGKHFQKAMITAHRPGDCAGIFLRTFGDARKTVRAMAANGKFSEIVVHLAPFDKTHQYQFAKYVPQVKKDAKWLEKLAKEFPGTKFLLSPFCEHRHQPTKMAPLFDALRKIAPTCLMLNSVWGVPGVPGTITEVHIPDAKHLPAVPKGEYCISFDGFGGDGSGDFPDADVPTLIARYPGARQIRYWNFRCNGKFGHLDTTPVDKRKTWPGVDYLKGHRALLDPREGGVTWPKSKLWKPFADDHGGGPGSKDNKAMCILPVKKAEVKVLDQKGNVIDVMRRFMPDHELGARYYSGMYAYKIAENALKCSGSKLITVEGSPPTDPTFRSHFR